MALIRYDLSPVRDAVTGEIRTQLVGQQVRIVLRDTTTPASIFEDAAGQIAVPSARLTVLPTFAVPTIYHDPANGLLDWLDEASGARGPLTSEQGLATSAAAAAASSASSAQAAAASAQAAQAAASAAETASLPAGGTTGQALVKLSDTPRHVGWATVGGGGGGGGGGSVQKVAGVSPDGAGNVPLTPQNLGLGEVDNTADEDKPVSGPQQAALDGKADVDEVVKVTGPQNVAGVKTFTSKPSVPDASFPIAKVDGLADALDAKVASTSVDAVWTGSQAAYDALAAKDSRTLYLVTGG